MPCVRRGASISQFRNLQILEAHFYRLLPDVDLWRDDPLPGEMRKCSGEQILTVGAVTACVVTASLSSATMSNLLKPTAIGIRRIRSDNRPWLPREGTVCTRPGDGRGRAPPRTGGDRPNCQGAVMRGRSATYRPARAS